ncbi:hypothetical protein BKA00_007434 [Actinomadura coerulea]|uniref:Uncharacterized protein n=1 Tax=Actinomadura coerulea TaxID=46159 RepID=A0A7X0G6Q9_9ACTN|nr:hypothetical protein [Actinomadura coerulea]MBB6400520.1 hypothetical protein [Actinomadura coerulea]GGQ07809.1 hypothetical protein GCM10010187_24870 [Actinomadura coerulea]
MGVFATRTRVELNLGGTWTDVTSRVYERDPITITRGTSANGSSPDPSRLTLTMDNRDGVLSPRNPVSPYFGKLGRNTPIRLSLPYGSTSMLTLPTQDGYAECPDSAALDITGDLDVRVEVEADSWDRGDIVGKYIFTGAEQRSWLLWTDDGVPTFSWTTAGTFASRVNATASTRLPFRRGRGAVRATLDVDNGASGWSVRFYTASTLAGPWTQLGTTVTGAGVTSIFASTSPLQLGDAFPGDMAVSGRYAGLEVRNGIDGPVVANPNFAAATPGAKTLTDSAGNVWTLRAQAEITDRAYRFHGEVAEWPQSWDTAGKDRYVSVSAFGIRRRLSSNSPPIRSSMFRRHTALTEQHVIGYWPLEDGKGSEAFAAASPGTLPALYYGSPDLAASNEWTASDALPVLESGMVYARVRAYAATGESVVRCFMWVQEAPAAETSLCWIDTTGTHSFEVKMDAFGAFRIIVRNRTGDVVTTTGAISFDMVTRGLTMFQVELSQQGTGVKWRVRVLDFAETDRVGQGVSGPFWEDTVPSATLGTIYRVYLARDKAVGKTVVGHLAVADSLAGFTGVLNATYAWNGEVPSDRIVRLCSEEGIPCLQLTRGRYYEPNPVRMGDQLPGAFTDLLDEAADADQGMLFETRDLPAFAYRFRPTLVNQTPAVTLDYSAGEIAADLAPVDDDSALVNDVTVTRVAGSALRLTQTTGPLSTATPPAGVGVYAVDAQLSLENDGMLRDAAGWRLTLGQVDEARYPRLTVALHSPRLSLEKRKALLTLDMGDRLDITNIGGGMPAEDATQLVLGYTETIRLKEHSLVFNLTPESPYRAAVVDDGSAGRVDASGSVLAAPAPTAPPYAGVAKTYVNGTTVPVPLPPGDHVTVCLVWNTTATITMVPAGWTLRGSLTASSSKAAVYTAAAGVADSTFVFSASSKCSVIAVGHNSATYVSMTSLLDAGTDAVHEAPAYTVSTAPVALLRFYWEKSSTASSWTKNDPAATVRATQFGVGSGAVSLLATGQSVSTAGTVPVATATSDLSTGQAGGFTVALASTAGVPTDYTSVSTALAVTPGDGNRGWTVNPADLPFDVMCAGERMTVTAVSGSPGGPQVLTAVRSVNGIVKPLPVGAEVRVFTPAIATY